jgi:hypothetical protein
MFDGFHPWTYLGVVPAGTCAVQYEGGLYFAADFLAPIPEDRHFVAVDLQIYPRVLIFIQSLLLIRWLVVVTISLIIITTTFLADIILLLIIKLRNYTL